MGGGGNKTGVMTLRDVLPTQDVIHGTRTSGGVEKCVTSTPNLAHKKTVS
jgi:hypothetical protein